MDSNCYQCSKPIKTIEVIQCNGFCHQSAHLKCVGLIRPHVDFVNEQNNILWFCDHCIAQLEYIKQNPMKSTQDVVAVFSNALRESLGELKTELQETKELTKTLVDKRQFNDSAAVGRSRTAWPSIKRTRDTTPKPRPDLKLVGGTKSIDLGSASVETVAKPTEKFWVYLSRIARHVTEDDISELVKQCLETTQPVDVRKLVRKDADVNQYAFISFKFGVEKDLKDKALDPSVWPKGIFFREFENLRAERDFWGPAKIPRTEVRTPRMISTQHQTPTKNCRQRNARHFA
ncbi:uncharacterized protein LOC129728727 [Wyeomyia smithii]|uniref:uncharacterized protein LOC129728727 n=1 Tax=Wyeomyia smithii TaxID=174621 RepID=UPI002468009F|nr:uncharacterized protein LOC129728727 [Wyeomyia smithii]